MTATPSIDPARFLHEQLAQASPDLLRELLTTFVNALMSADADAVCGAEYGTRSTERTNRRNGGRHRDFDTRAGTVDAAVPKLRERGQPDGGHAEVVVAAGQGAVALGLQPTRRRLRARPVRTASSTPSPTSSPRSQPILRAPAPMSSRSRRSRKRSGARSGPTTHPSGSTASRRRTDVVGIFPDRDAIVRLVGAVLAEQHDEWTEGRRYLGLGVLARARNHSTDTEEVTDTDLKALSA